VLALLTAAALAGGPTVDLAHSVTGGQDLTKGFTATVHLVDPKATKATVVLVRTQTVTLFGSSPTGAEVCAPLADLKLDAKELEAQAGGNPVLLKTLVLSGDEDGDADRKKAPARSSGDGRADRVKQSDEEKQREQLLNERALVARFVDRPAEGTTVSVPVGDSRVLIPGADYCALPVELVPQTNTMKELQVVVRTLTVAMTACGDDDACQDTALTAFDAGLKTALGAVKPNTTTKERDALRDAAVKAVRPTLVKNRDALMTAVSALPAPPGALAAAATAPAGLARDSAAWELVAHRLTVLGHMDAGVITPETELRLDLRTGAVVSTGDWSLDINAPISASDADDAPVTTVRDLLLLAGGNVDPDGRGGALPVALATFDQPAHPLGKAFSLPWSSSAGHAALRLKVRTLLFAVDDVLDASKGLAADADNAARIGRDLIAATPTVGAFGALLIPLSDFSGEADVFDDNYAKLTVKVTSLAATTADAATLQSAVWTDTESFAGHFFQGIAGVSFSEPLGPGLVLGVALVPFGNSGANDWWGNTERNNSSQSFSVHIGLRAKVGSSQTLEPDTAKVGKYEEHTGPVDGLPPVSLGAAWTLIPYVDVSAGALLYRTYPGGITTADPRFAATFTASLTVRMDLLTAIQQIAKGN
jgi:hypothetical protein